MIARGADGVAVQGECLPQIVKSQCPNTFTIYVTIESTFEIMCPELLVTGKAPDCEMCCGKEVAQKAEMRTSVKRDTEIGLLRNYRDL